MQHCHDSILELNCKGLHGSLKTGSGTIDNHKHLLNIVYDNFIALLGMQTNHNMTKHIHLWIKKHEKRIAIGIVQQKPTV